MLSDKQSEKYDNTKYMEVKMEPELKASNSEISMKMKKKRSQTISALSEVIMDRSSDQLTKEPPNEMVFEQKIKRVRKRKRMVKANIGPTANKFDSSDALSNETKTKSNNMKDIKEDKTQKNKIKRRTLKKRSKLAITVILLILLVFTIMYFGFRGHKNNPFASITDSDGDGHYDNVDAFINDHREWKDTDGDGVGDNSDDYPKDAKEWKDTDGDGIGDNSDIFSQGNGGIYLDILLYDGDGGYDTGEYGDLDPYFTIWMDINGNNEVEKDEISQSETYLDTDTITHAHNFWIDVKDDLETIHLGVWVTDNDFSYPDDVIDINSSAIFDSINITYHPKVDANPVILESDGSSDNASHEDDAYIKLSYGICELQPK